MMGQQRFWWIPLRHWLAGLLAISGPLCASQAGALPPDRLVVDYVVKYSGRMSAEASMRTELTHDGKAYSITEESRGRGLAAVLMPGVLRRSAQGAITSGGLQVLTFADRRGSRPEQTAKFDWVRQVIQFAQDDKEEVRAFPEQRPLTDRLSFLWLYAFAGEPAPGRELRPALVDGRGFASFRYQVQRSETWNSPTGPLRVVRLVKQVDPGDDRTTEIWLAADRGYIPVRVLVAEKDGSRTDQMITGMSR